MNKEERLKAADDYANGKSSSEVFRRSHIADFIAGAEAESESKWVSVEDRYPNENEEIIVYFEYKFEGRETETGVTSAIYETQNTLRHCFYQHNGSVVVGVVKWQHMPTP